MGFFDLFKKKRESAAETVKGPTRVLKEAGIDTSGLRTRIDADGRVTVSGTVANPATRDRIEEVLEDMPQVTGVTNLVRVGTPEPPAGEREPDSAGRPAAQPESALGQADARRGEAEHEQRGGRTYTVEPGDTLWKISERFYGKGSEYMRIFEANQPLLKDPDKIYPGQELLIPRSDD